MDSPTAIGGSSASTASYSLNARASWKRRALSCVLIVLGCFGGYYLGNFAAVGLNQNRADQKLDSVNGLGIDSRSLDLGEVWETPNHPLTLQVQNVGDQVRSIVDFSGSCGCLKVEPQKLTIAPGETTELSLTVDLTHRLPYQIGLAQWPVSVKFNPVFQGDFASTPGWELKGLVRSRVSLDAMQIAFTDQCRHSGREVTRKVRARARVPLQRLEVSAVPPLANVRVESVPESPDSYVILISPHPELPVGPFTFEVQVKAVTPDGEIHRCASIEASGEIQPSTGVFPRLILLGEQPVASQCEADVSVRLPANGWTIQRMETDSPDTSLTRADTRSNEAINLRLSQKIIKHGDQVTHARILVCRPDKEMEVLKVEVRYHGVEEPGSSEGQALRGKQD